MKLKEIYDLAIKMGQEADPRGKEEIERVLKKEQEKYKDLKKEEKECYDVEKLKNPYSDTRILFGDENIKVKRILCGVDISSGEVVLADRLSDKGKKIDLIISHHPEGYALAALSDVMDLQADVWAKFGMPINIAEGILQDRIKEVQRGLMPINHNQAVDSAKLLNIPLICVHTPTDNIVTNYLQKQIDKEKPSTLRDLKKILKEIPEYKNAAHLNAGPVILIGEERGRCGKVMVDMTGGTSGPKEMMEKLAQAGVGTLACMHVKEDARKEAKARYINIVIAGHISSDSIGLNLFLDELEKGGVEIIPCSGLIRVRR